MVVPMVRSFTEMPIISPSVNSELTSGWPHSVSRSQKCRSMCSGCGFSVMLENSTLSISVTVRVRRWRMVVPTSKSSSHMPPRQCRSPIVSSLTSRPDCSLRYLSVHAAARGAGRALAFQRPACAAVGVNRLFTIIAAPSSPVLSCRKGGSRVGLDDQAGDWGDAAVDAMFLFTTPKAPAPIPPPPVPQPAPAGGATGVMGALRTASETTGTSFDYLLKTARRESDLDPTLKSKTSTATGLFQFLDDTWLETLKADGARYGYGEYAAAITRAPSGNLDIADPALKRQVMALREDPTANAVMAGAFTNRNAADLRALLGRQPTDGELYVAHFFGSAGARKFLDLAATQPAARADTVFPEAAAANRPIFYDKSGRARSAAEVYAVLVKQHGTETTTSATATVAAPAPAAPTQGTTALGLAPEPAEPPLPFAFHGLFQTERTGPAIAEVRSLWVPQAARAAYATGAGKTSGDAGRPLDLGTFVRTSGVDTRE